MADQIDEITQDFEAQGRIIINDIFHLMKQYTNDSALPKFFLPEEIATACYGLTAGFTATIYEPLLPPKITVDCRLLSFLYALVTYGFNIYLKEHSLLTNSAPYTLPYDKQVINKAQKRTLDKTAEGKLTATPLVNTTIALIINNVSSQMNMKDFTIEDYQFNDKKFWEYAKISLYWGYNFAKELLDEKSKKTKPESKRKMKLPKKISN
jgi:hypothetical protein